MSIYYQDDYVTLYHGDALDVVESLSGIHLTVTSPPYVDLIKYADGETSEGQVGDLEFSDWSMAMQRLLDATLTATTEGGRAVVNVGDVCVSRRKAGRHYTFPLAASLTMSAFESGWDVLTPIRWEKIANVSMEASTSSGVLGKPNQPGGVIKNDSESLLLFRKAGSYRKPTPEQVKGAHIPSDEYKTLFRGTWRDIPGASSKEHPATFPLTLPSRLIRMFSFPGDTVLDPFAGTGTTLVAARNLGRHAIGVEIEERYCEIVAKRLAQDALNLFGDAA